MKFNKFFLAVFLFLETVIIVQSMPAVAQNQQGVPRPKLVVGIVVDQMRWDFIYRYYARYGTGGFKRFLNEGFTSENVNINYVPSFTAVGHSAIYTGAVPAVNGIVGNDFIIQATGKSMYCTGDSTAQTLGSTSNAGQMSPRNLLVTTLGDELKLATNFRAKVVGVALKDRGGILPAGHTANAAYWFDDLTGNWISSTYYMNDLPDWVKRFNGARHAERYLKQNWNTLYPMNTYVQSFPDDNVYEGKLTGTSSPTLPVRTSQMFGSDFNIIRYTPYGNSLTLDMAKEVLDQEQLGKHLDTDMLAVSLSSTDYIGHQFGPNSVEIEDTYLRLDRDLAAFFAYLDKQIGKGNYTVFLTADHGAAHNPQLLIDKNIPAGFLNGKKVLDDLNAVLEGKYATPLLVLSLSNYEVNLNQVLIAQRGLNQASIVTDCIRFLETQPGIAFVVDMRDAQATTMPHVLRQRIENGYYAERCGVIEIIPSAGWFQGYGTTGTTHGTTYAYDMHVPLLMMGWGIKPGRSNSKNDITDIAPTISALLHIQVPSGAMGKVIVEALK